LGIFKSTHVLFFAPAKRLPHARVIRCDSATHTAPAR
jgi:hypothetical protein